MNKKYIWAFLGIAILLGTAFILSQKKPTLIPTENVATANYDGWKSYSNTSGLSFLYPADWNFHNYETENLGPTIADENATEFNVSTGTSYAIGDISYIHFQIDTLTKEEQALSLESFFDLHFEKPSTVTPILLDGEKALKVHFLHGVIKTKFSAGVADNLDLIFIKRPTYAIYITTEGDQIKIDQIFDSISFVK